MLSDIINKWLFMKQATVKQSTMAAYALNLEKHIIPFFCSKEQFDQQDIRDFVDSKLSEGLSIKRIKDILMVFKMVLKFANDAGNNYPEIPTIKFTNTNGNQELPVFSSSQQKTMMDFLIANLNFKNLGLLICFSTGMRIGEICGLKWEDIDFERGLLSVRRTVYRVGPICGVSKIGRLVESHPKTRNSYRVIPLSEKLLSIISELREEIRDDGYVVTNDLRPMEPRAYRYYYDRLLEELKLPHVRFHGIRHSFATRCIENECDYKAVSMILGHADISTTLNMYVHPSLEHRKNCIEKMLASLSSK